MQTCHCHRKVIVKDFFRSLTYFFGSLKKSCHSKIACFCSVLPLVTDVKLFIRLKKDIECVKHGTCTREAEVLDFVAKLSQR